MKFEYQENMKDWVSEQQYQKISDSVKAAYFTFCNWWNQNQVHEWNKIPAEILEAWKLIKNEGWPDFYLVTIDSDEKIGLISSSEYYSN